MDLTTEMDALTKNGMSSEDRSSRNSSSGGSSTSEKSRMLDITRDKPIKVAVRVAVPVRDHPKFNFVGKLLGPKGNSMKRLQEETMCKMAVLGRGSMKDRKKEEELRMSGDPRYSHLSEDLHVEISTFAAPAEAHARIAYSLAEVRRFLVPDYHDDIRQEQMWEMQALSTSGQNLDSTIESIDMIESDHDSSSDISLSNNNNNNSIITNSCDMQIDIAPVITTTRLQQQQPTSNGTHHPITTNINTNTAISTSTSTTTLTTQLPNEAETQTIALVETPGTLLHPALRGVKTVNISGGLARKRPLLGVPRSSMNPTKRTVMTLLARAKSAQALHNARTGFPAAIREPIQMITTSPIIIQRQEPISVITQNGNKAVASVEQQEISVS